MFGELTPSRPCDGRVDSLNGCRVPSSVLTERFQAALGQAFGDEYADADPVIRPSQFADFQANAALALAKRLGENPRAVAQKIVDALDLTGIAEAPEISGPGFVNVRLSSAWIGAQVDGLDDRLGVPTQEQQIIPVDYSAPNVAKEMHVGHLRTTVVGDALVRTLEHLGHRVIRQNHVGDWGTMFGMLIEHLLDVGEDSIDAQLMVTDPNAFYAAANAEFQGDPEFATRARSRVVKLQGGDEDTLRHWHELVGLSKQYFNRIYDTLGVTLTDADLAGESTYNDELAGICDELEARASRPSATGRCACSSTATPAVRASPVPLIIRKSDGGYGYATTDLATIRRRVRDMQADRILYVIGVTQSLHLNMVWDTARKAGWLTDDVEVVHVQIGSVLGEDRKLLRTRSGKPLKLMDLLEEAVATARAVVDEARPDLDEGVRAAIAPQVGIGAIKYADLAVAHDSDYVFDLDRMVLAHRQHRALPPVRRRADPLHLPLRRSRPGAGRRTPGDHRAGRARPRAGPARLRRRRRPRRRPARAAPPLRLPLRPRAALLRVLRAVPRAQGRQRGPRLPPRAVQGHARRPRPGPRPPRYRAARSRCDLVPRLRLEPLPRPLRLLRRGRYAARCEPHVRRLPRPHSPARDHRADRPRPAHLRRRVHGVGRRAWRSSNPTATARCTAARTWSPSSSWPTSPRRSRATTRRRSSPSTRAPVVAFTRS